MIVLESIEKIIAFDSLSDVYRNDLKAYFATQGNDKIIEIEKGKYYTSRQLLSREEPVDIRVEYNPDMFFLATPIVMTYGYAIADDQDGNHVAVLTNQDCTYAHPYLYEGGADLWFLDQYDCIFLHGCNEFSVELCQSALRLWKGKQLVLVGNEWEQLIPMLPDLPGVVCYYEPNLTQDRFLELVQGQKFLHAIYGIPHAESMERYNQGVMYYDEIMSFTFMFSDYRELGPLNEDKNFFVMDGYYGGLGLFAIFPKVETCARYAKSKGFIPVIQLTMGEENFYQNMVGEDIWKKFYNQPENYTLDEVMRSKHVFFSPGFYNGSVQSNIMNQASGANTTLTWPHGIYNDNVKSYIQEKQKQFLPCPEKTLGVLARGTDYVNTHLHNHPIHASKEMICEKIDEVWETWGGFEYIYIATEDAEYCEYFKERYGERVYFTDQERYTTKPGETLSQMHSREKEKRDGYLLGVEYITSINLLSKCQSFIASGGCGGVDEAIRENGGNYKNVYIFNLGINQ